MAYTPTFPNREKQTPCFISSGDPLLLLEIGKCPKRFGELLQCFCLLHTPCRWVSLEKIE